MSRKRRRHAGPARVILGWIFFILIVMMLIMAGMFLVRYQVTVPDQAMSPTLEEGDSIAVERLGYRFLNPKRYDVIVFPARYDKDTLLVRRIVALPGETIRIADGKIYVNGTALDEPVDLGTIQDAGTAFSTLTLNEDEYFVLCDDRKTITDSRQPAIGMVRRSDIYGKALLRTWPLLGIKLIR